MIWNPPPHNRIYPFRPARREYDTEKGRAALYLRFLRAYVWPFRGAVALITLFVCMESCSWYLLAYFTKTVVDDILVVQTPAATVSVAAPGVGRDGASAALNDRHHGGALPASGLGWRMDQGLTNSNRPPDAVWRLARIFVVYLTTIIALNLLSRLVARMRIRVSTGVVQRLRDDVHRKIMDLSLSYHHAHSPGRLLSRILYDVGAVQDGMLNTIINATAQLVMVVIGFTILISINWHLAAYAALVLPVYVFIYKRGRPKLKLTSHEMSHTNSCLYGLVAQKLDSIRAVQAYGRERQEHLSFHRLSAVFLRDGIMQARVSAALGRMGEVLSTIGTNGAVFLLGAWYVLEGKMTVGAMLYAYGTAASLFGPVLQLSNLNLVITNLLVYLRRLANILDEPIEIHDAQDAVEFPAPLQRGIAIRNVSFRYGPDSDPIFHNITLDVPKGEWLCIMGASGCGKSTLLHLLARLYEPTNGEIVLDDTPISRIQVAGMRRHLALVPQEARIFSGSVRDNIAYGYPDASPAEIMASAKAAELHPFIMDMKVQYETLLGEKGTSLSGGQKQRLSLARALLTNPDVLLLDDCTSALDAETERRIQDTLARILVGKTAVIVTQRISMAQRCHRIAVLADGIVSEYGTHAELVALGGFYSRLHTQQTE